MTDETNTWAMRAAVAFGLLLAGGFAGWLVHAAAIRGGDVSMIAFYKDWRLACPAISETKTNCEMVTDVLDTKSHGKLAQTAFAIQRGKRIIVLTVPLQVLLEPGIGLKIDAKAPHIYRYSTCVPGSCFALSPADDKLFSDMRKAKSVALVVVGPDGKPVTLSVSMKGFDDAQDVFTSREAKRGSWFWRVLS